MSIIEKKFKIGDIVYITHGVGELNIKSFEITMIRGKSVYGFDKFGKEFKLHIGNLILARELLQEVYDYIENTQFRR